MSKRGYNSHQRRYGDVNRSGSTRTIIIDVPTSSTLIYPVTETTDTSTSGGLTITMGQFISLAHRAFVVNNSAGNRILEGPPDGGPWTLNGANWRVYNSVGATNYGGIVGNGSDAPYIELPDAGSGSGRGRMYGGQAAPGSTTIGSTTAAQVGDFYWRQRTGTNTQVLYVCTVAGSPGTWTLVI